MEWAKEGIAQLGLPTGDAYHLPTSSKRFPDGAQYRVEIPSVEGPAALRAVLEEAHRHGITIHRVSQGSGIMLLKDDEILEMAELGREHQMEVSLFVGPRAPFDIGAQPLTQAGKNIGWRHTGIDQLVYALEDVRRCCELGIRSILVADEGLLWLIKEFKRLGKLPQDLVVKVSVLMGASNPVSIRIVQDLGASTYNVSSDQSLPRLAAIRQVVNIAIDMYIEAPDDFGGFVRHYEMPEIIRVLSPIYVKFGLRNAPNIYPSGTHLETTAISLSRERVRRAAIAMEMIKRHCPELKISELGAEGLGVPVKPSV
jgi:hypothetical protein